MNQTTTTLDHIGIPENGKSSALLQLKVDARHVETWELMIMEAGRVTDFLLVFARYLCKGEALVSPNLPSKPIDELNRAERAQIMNSQAYKLLKRMKIPALQAAAMSFLEQAATIDADPN